MSLPHRNPSLREPSRFARLAIVLVADVHRAVDRRVNVAMAGAAGEQRLRWTVSPELNNSVIDQAAGNNEQHYRWRETNSD
jgi:hypothetical protein